MNDIDQALLDDSTPAAAAQSNGDPWAAQNAPPASDPWAAQGLSADSADPWAAPNEARPDPWAAPEGAGAAEAAVGADPWSAGAADTSGGTWNSAGSADLAEPGFTLQQLWDGSLPLQSWINDGLTWAVDAFRPFFQAVRGPIDTTLGGVESLLTGTPMPVMLALLGLLAWQFAGRGVAIGGVLSLLLVGALGIWTEAMVTLSLVLTSLLFCVALGLPLGVLLASSDRAQRWLRPLLDAMQTTPAFVYLVPVVMLFGIGNVPGVIVTIIFALPPLVRLTNLGIRQVRPDLIEAGRAYGASRWQMLVKVQLPLAMPSIMAGVNQALMLALSMVVIASMIAVGGLGQMVLRGIGRLDMGLAAVGGLGIVLLAITLDRITQALGTTRHGARHWWQTGPVGLALHLLPRRAPTAPGQAEASPSAPPQTEAPARRAPDPVLQGAVH